MVLPGSAGELALYRREDALDQRALSVLFAGKVFAHLAAYARGAAIGEALGRDDAVGFQPFAAEGEIALEIEFGIG